MNCWRDDELLAVWEDWSQMCGEGWVKCTFERNLHFLGMVFLRCGLQGVWPRDWVHVTDFTSELQGACQQMLELGVPCGGYQNVLVVHPDNKRGPAV